MTTHAIESSFPIVEINRLAVPERNSFKPIYEMHKWFARRASCVFRAMLLGCLKPDGTDVMAEYYHDHTGDPDTTGKLVLDPFMGGGTTVVEALRLGCKVVGVDLNPVAWFVVKTEIEPVCIPELRDAFDQLAQRTVPWSGKSVRETLLEQYKTECPCCQREADIIYTFWVKSAICHNITCPGRSGNQGPEVPLFPDYIVVQKSPSIRYWRDVTCPNCSKTFDWEVEPGTYIAEPGLQVNAPRSGGEGRTSSRWAFSTGDEVQCPWCAEVVQPLPPKTKAGKRSARKERKKVPLTVLRCPDCESIWQYRGELPDQLSCPVCQHAYDPHKGNAIEKGSFLCPHCGTKDDVIASIRRLPDDVLLPARPYAIHGHCSYCSGEDTQDDSAVGATDLFGELINGSIKANAVLDHDCPLSKMGGKFVKRVSPHDLKIYQHSVETWNSIKQSLPYPQQEIPVGYNTNQVLKHHYRFWHDMFTIRQLLCHATLLQAIDSEPSQTLKELLLNAFSNMLDSNCGFAFYPVARQAMARMFTRHDFQPRMMFVENNPWGRARAGYTFPTFFETVVEGKTYATEPYELKPHPQKVASAIKVPAGEKLPAALTVDLADLRCQSSEMLPFLMQRTVDFIITDPPYAGNVNYSELSDFFYVWLRLVLGKTYVQFAPELTPKLAEIVENDARGKSIDDFERGLTDVFRECARVLKDDGVMAFTFHHAEGSAWEAVLESIHEAGFYLNAAYPVHADAFHSDTIGALGISYDLIHVCQKRTLSSVRETRSWAGMRQEIRRRARDEVRAIEAGRYGKEPLIPADVNIVLIGKCLELYSRHYGAVVDHEGNSVPLHEALIEIRNMVDQLIEKERPLPPELDEVDAASRVYLLTLAAKKEVKSDDLHKATRGILEPDDLLRAGLIIKGRAKRGRTFEVKQPIERLPQLLEVFQFKDTPSQPLLSEEFAAPTKTKHTILFIDRIHLLLGIAESGENLMPWLERFAGERPLIRAACEYLAAKNGPSQSACEKVLRLLNPLPLFRGE